MADQLAINIQVTGAQAALAALQQIQQAYQGVLQQAQQSAGAQAQTAQQSAAATQRAAQQQQQNAQTISAAWDRANASVAQSQQSLTQATRLAAEERQRLTEQSTQAQVRAELQARQAIERSLVQGASAQERAALQGAQATQRAALQTEQALQRANLAAQQGNAVYMSLGGVLNGLPGPLGAAASGFGAFTFKMETSGAAALGLASILAGASASIVGSLGAATQAAAEYQLEMARVQTQVMDGNTHVAADMRQLSDAAMDLGARTAFTSTEIAKGFYELTGAGLDAKQALASIEPITQLAMVGQMKLADATANVITVQKQWGLSSADIGHIVDVEALAVQKSMLHYNELGEVYRNIAGRAHSMGVSLEETTAALMATRDAGLTASMAGTAVGTMLDRLAKSNGETRAAIEELGLQIYNTDGRFVGLIQRTGALPSFMEQVTESTRGMTEQQINHAESMLTGARASGFLRNALAAEKDVEVDGQTVRLKGVQLLQYYTEQLEHSTGALQRQADVIFGTWAMQSKMFNASLAESSIIIGRQFLPALEAVTPQATGLINLFIKAPDAVHEAAVAFLVLEAGVLAASAAIGVLTVAGDAIIPLLIGIGGALALVGPPLLVLTAATAALALAWANDWGGIREITATTVGDVRQELAGLSNDLSHVGTALGHGLGTVGADLSGLGALVNAAFRRSAADAGVDPEQVNAVGQQTGLALGEGVKLGLLNALPGGSLALIIAEAIHGAGRIADLADPSILPDPQASINRWVAQWADELTAATPDIVGAFRGGLKAHLDDGTLNVDMIDVMTGQLKQALEDRLGHEVGASAVRVMVERMVMEVQTSKLGGRVTEEIANQMGNEPEAINAAIRRLLTGAKDSVSKALTDALSQGNQAAAQGLIQIEAGTKAVQAALQGTDAAWQAQIAIMLHAQDSGNRLAGVQQTLAYLYQSGALTLQQYTDALGGVTEGHKRANTAAEEHRRQIQDLIGSTDAAQTSQGLYLQRMDAFIDKQAKLMPDLEGQIIALKNQGHEMDAVALIAARLGVSVDTLRAAWMGNADAMAIVDVADGKGKTAKQEHAAAVQNLTALIAAGAETEVAAAIRTQAMHADIQKAIQGTTAAYQAHILVMEQEKGAEAALNQLRADGVLTEEQYTQALNGGKTAHESAKTAAQEHKKELQELTGSTDAAKVSAGLYAQSLQQVIEGAIKPLDVGTRGLVRSLLNQNDMMGAAAAAAQGLGVPLDLLTAAANGSTTAIAQLKLVTDGLSVARDKFGRTTAEATLQEQLHKQAIDASVASQRTLYDAQVASDKSRADAINRYRAESQRLGYGLGGSLATAATPETRAPFNEQAVRDQAAAMLRQTPGAGNLFPGDLVPVGRQAAAGLAIGLQAGAPQVQAAAQGLADAGADTIRTAWQEHSPSLLFASFGEMAVAGLQSGFLGAMDGFTRTATEALSGVANTASTAFSLELQGGLGQAATPLDPGGGLLSGDDPLGLGRGDSRRATLGLSPLATEAEVVRAGQRIDQGLAARAGAWPSYSTAMQNRWEDAGQRQEIEALMSAYNVGSVKELEQRLGMRWSTKFGGSGGVGASERGGGGGGGGTGGGGGAGGRISLPHHMPDSAMGDQWLQLFGPGTITTPDLGRQQWADALASAQYQGPSGPQGFFNGGSFGATGSEINRAMATAGTGGATHEFDVSGLVGTDPAAIARYIEMTKQNWANVAATAKALGENTSLASLAWSSIKDLSDTVKTSVAGVAGAFSAYAMDLNSKGASSITGTWTQPTLGGPSGPQAVMPGSAPTQGLTGNPGELMRQAAINIGGWAQNLGVPLGEAAQQWAALSQQAGDTEGALRAAQVAQDDATDEVNRLRASQAAGAAVQSQLTAAEQRLATATGQLAAIRGDVADATAGSFLNPVNGNNAPGYSYRYATGQEGVSAPAPVVGRTGVSVTSTGGGTSITVPEGTTYNDYIRLHPPSLDVGGYVEATGLAVVHRGETYSGVGGTAPVIQVTYAPTIAGTDAPEQAQAVTKMLDLLEKEVHRRGYALSRR